MMVETPDVLRDPVSRRTFLARMSAAGLGTAAAALLAGCGGSNSQTGGGNGLPANNSGSNSGGGNGLTTFADQANFPNIPGPNENAVVFNFALTLEHLEADLYRQLANIATNQNLPFNGPNVYTNPQLAIQAGGTLTAAQAQAGLTFLTQYAATEAAHRDFLFKTGVALAGGTPVPPNPNGYTPTGLPSNPTLFNILTFLQQVEEEGVRAYFGAAGFLTNPALTQAAATIYTTEARHSAGLNFALGKDAGPMTGASAPSSPDRQLVAVNGTTISDNTLEKSKAPAAVLQDVKPFFVSSPSTNARQK